MYKNGSEGIKIIPAYDCGVNNADLEAAIRRMDDSQVIKKFNSREFYYFPRSTWCPTTKPLFHYNNNISISEEWHDVNTFDINVIWALGVLSTIVLIVP